MLVLIFILVNQVELKSDKLPWYLTAIKLLSIKNFISVNGYFISSKSNAFYGFSFNNNNSVVHISN